MSGQRESTRGWRVSVTEPLLMARATTTSASEWLTAYNDLVATVETMKASSSSPTVAFYFHYKQQFKLAFYFPLH
jgi:hypothetical protein